MCGNLAGDGSKEGVSTEKTFSSVIASIFLCFFGVIPFITSRSCKGYCSNNDDTSFEEGRVLSGVDDFKFLFGEREFFEDSFLSFETFGFETLDFNSGDRLLFLVIAEGEGIVGRRCRFLSGEVVLFFEGVFNCVSISSSILHSNSSELNAFFGLSLVFFSGVIRSAKLPLLL